MKVLGILMSAIGMGAVAFGICTASLLHPETTGALVLSAALIIAGMLLLAIGAGMTMQQPKTRVGYSRWDRR